MARSGIRLLMWTTVLGLLNLHVNGNGDGEPRVELECRISAGPAPAAGAHPLDRYLVEIKTPTGRVVSQATAQGGGRVKFRRLFAGIFAVCVIATNGERRCQSVDVYPGPNQEFASFSIELQPPSASSTSMESFSVVQKDALRIPKKARREFERAEKAQSRGDRAEATRRLESALEIWPDYPEALINLGSLRYSSGNYDEAFGCFSRVIEIAPAMHEGWLNLGITQLARGEPREALKSELRALALLPDDSYVNCQVGFCYYMLGHLDKAKEYLRRVVELDPCSATYPHLYLARIALVENQPDEAARLLADCSRLHPHGGQPPGFRDIQQKIEQAPPRAQPLD